MAIPALVKRIADASKLRLYIVYPSVVAEVRGMYRQEREFMYGTKHHEYEVEVVQATPDMVFPCM